MGVNMGGGANMGGMGVKIGRGGGQTWEGCG